MQVKISTNNVELSLQQRHHIDISAGMHLARYTGVIVDYELNFKKVLNNFSDFNIVATSHVLIKGNTTTVKVQVNAMSVDEVISLIMKKTRRTLSRHLRFRQFKITEATQTLRQINK